MSVDARDPRARIRHTDTAIVAAAHGAQRCAVRNVDLALRLGVRGPAPRRRADRLVRSCHRLRRRVHHLSRRDDSCSQKAEARSLNMTGDVTHDRAVRLGLSYRRRAAPTVQVKCGQPRARAAIVPVPTQREPLDAVAPGRRVGAALAPRLRTRSTVRPMSRDEAARLADGSLSRFVAFMSASGNPGSGRHEVGLHHVRGWILEYDPTIGGAEIQAVIGIDGVIHARREPRSLRAQKLSAASWVLRHGVNSDPMASATAFADHLARILAFDGAASDSCGGEQPPSESAF